MNGEPIDPALLDPIDSSGLFINGYGWTPPEKPAYGLWTDGEDIAIRSLLSAGATYAAIATALGRSRPAVSGHIFHRQIRPEYVDSTPRADNGGGA